ncbi:tol-pal system protein YbgF [Candidatus Fukatsuia symbiotica]|uniref:Cell division coordinator CpoB n=1 Tax=Candidatus Fukatsuia symbiotica TaxID=1878942 RepID=A0A2U8I9G7_9GAMM|nr:tol-pal system protein YbgF [Candidatus Fukatsuia symbiotica]AWK14705.1 tol-pal system protein YbgF [Candidatus Fukatsuia symbiotica]MEA9445033.1 tol-pal system protein YbgF [Candidatus Fukatsuia symbiotica]
MNSNCRCYLLSLSLLFGVAVPSAATAEASISGVGSGSLEDHVTQLERIVNAHSQLLTQLQQQLSDSQRDIESLRGQIQNNQYQLNQIVGQPKMAQRAESLIGQEIPGNTEPDTSAKSTVVPEAASNTKIPVNDDENAYKQATSSREKQQYDQAIVAFENFLTQYPESVYLPNVNYWLGQLYYNNKGEKDIAASYYAFVVKNYPQSAKSADAMLKVGMIMQDKKQTDKAKAVYQQVIKKYPNSQAAAEAQKKLASF